MLDYVRALARAGMPTGDVVIAWYLMMLSEDGGGEAVASYADLARGTGLGRSTAVAAVGRLKAHGWLEAERTAHWGAMAYRPKLGRSYP